MAKTSKKLKIDKIEIVGWIGAIMFLASYAMVSSGVLSANTLIYQFMNLIGSIIAIIISVKHDVKQNILVNAVWSTVAIVSIFVIIFK